MFVAHIRGSDRVNQSVEEHLKSVKKLSEARGEKIGVRHIAGLAGMLHDMGKYTEEFRQYINDAVYHPEKKVKRGSVDHSTAGGKFLFDLLHNNKPDKFSWLLAEVVGNAIISHHSYLNDYLNPDLESDYLRRVNSGIKEKVLYEYDSVVQCFYTNVMSEEELQSYIKLAMLELEDYLTKSTNALTSGSKLMFLTKFLFSVLIDSDRTNTRMFEENQIENNEKKVEELFLGYYEKLIKKMETFQSDTTQQNEINQFRHEMSEQCEGFAYKPSGTYRLSIPTGGGKTLSSFRYALRHSIEHGKKRIIYVVPYTTIIEQNAEEIRKIIKDHEHLLEHHSNIICDENDNDEMQDGAVELQQKLKLARETWDSPIIFTTMVQFLDVFYAKSSGSIRRLHQLCESVIIFDEVQKVPIHCVALFNQALNFLNLYGKSSLILCTATQPALEHVTERLEISSDDEIITNLELVENAFKRVEIIDLGSSETFDSDKLAIFAEKIISETNSIMVILNTKSVVKRLYKILDDSGLNIPIYHLSTSMCAAHRQDILEEVREKLQNKEKVICVSTQLIEAGVDISFECVVRSLAGLDSIAQAAGRCNRHGEYDSGKVFVIDHGEENLDRLREIQVGKDISKKMLIDLKNNPREYGGGILSSIAIECYFKRFFDKLSGEVNYPIPKLRSGMTMVNLLSSERNTSIYHNDYRNHNNGIAMQLGIVNSYRTAATHFNVIEGVTQSVIVPYGQEGKDIIADLNGDCTIEDLSTLLKKAQRYVVNLFSYEIRQLDQNEGLVHLFDGKVMALHESAYNKKFGVDITNESEFSNCIK